MKQWENHIPTAPLAGKILCNAAPHSHELKELEWDVKQQDISVSAII